MVGTHEKVSTKSTKAQEKVVVPGTSPTETLGAVLIPTGAPCCQVAPAMARKWVGLLVGATRADVRVHAPVHVCVCVCVRACKWVVVVVVLCVCVCVCVCVCWWGGLAMGL